MKFYLWIDNSAQGPFPRDQVLGKLSAGSISNSTLARTDEPRAPWCQLSELRDSLNHVEISQPTETSNQSHQGFSTTPQTPFTFDEFLWWVGFISLVLLPFVGLAALTEESSRRTGLPAFLLVAGPLQSVFFFWMSRMLKEARTSSDSLRSIVELLKSQQQPNHSRQDDHQAKA